MASSDDEGETFPDAVSDYYFDDGDHEPLSFSKLSVQWNESESSSAITGRIYLGGTVDNGLRKFYQQVKAWKFDLLSATPEISVLSKDNHWIKLQKPRKSFVILVRTILITLHCLCFLKRKPEASGQSLWDHLSKVFSLYDVRPSENDLIDHISFIREAIKRDEALAKSKFLTAFLENPRKRKSSDEDVGTATKPSFIVDDTDELQDDDFIAKQTEDSDCDEDDHFDSVCAICDNGGSLTCCDGKCFRSFHANGDSEEAQESKCESLCVTPEALKPQQFKCENCQYSLHQCFVCGELGSSDKSSNTEVFRCSSATCGHFYHPLCVAILLQKNDKVEQQTLKEKIAAGDPFICPAHKCAVCKHTENEKMEDMQFAICRRCPTSYHRKCLPRDIMFEHQVGDDDDDEVRAWDGLLPKSRALIYCVKHDIDPELATPARTLKFRNILISKTKTPSELSKKKRKVAVKETGATSEHLLQKKSLLNSQKGVEKSSAIKPEGSLKKKATVLSGPDSVKKKKIADTSKNYLRRNLSTNIKKPTFDDNQPTLGSRLYDLYTGTESNNLEKDVTSVHDNKQVVAPNSSQKEVLPPIDDDSKQRILALMKDADSSVSLEDIKKYHQGKVPSTYAHSSNKSIILARVEGSVEALHVALKKLEEGCSVEDAMAVCEPADIDKLLRWKEKLRVYLAPFLHGMRYTSFGRHFTKVEKLEKVVDKLQWYIEDGDTVVDFCCGANDFSCLVKKRLDEIGKKKCSYKNYDITRPKNDFNFEKRDWMTVTPKELPSGSQLIMGLNPPFGVNASLANQFIEKALRFKPKLLVLIVPRETERLDSEKKRVPYDLVWEDVELLAGKSFYLPGSIDVNDKQMDQWNNTPPPLYLWSHPEWTSKHKTIAQQHGHIPVIKEAPQSDENVAALDLSVVTNVVDNDPLEPLVDLPPINKYPERTKDKAKKSNNNRKRKGKPAHDNGGTETKNKPISKEEKPNQNSNKRNRHNQEMKLDKRDDKLSCDSSRQDQEAEKDDHKNPLAHSHEDQAQKNDKIQAPSREDEALYYDKTRDPSRDDQALKLEKTRAPSRDDQAQKLEKTRAPSCDDQAQKLEKTRAPSRDDQAQKLEKTRAPSRDDQAQKLDKIRAPSRDDQTQKFDKIQAPSRDDQTQKFDKIQASAREYQGQKHERSQASPREYQAPSREMEARKHDNKYNSTTTREAQAQKPDSSYYRARENDTLKLDNKHNSGSARVDQVHETRDPDFSFLNDVREQLVDQNLEMRYDDESTFSLQNDVGPSFDHLLERRYHPTAEEPYLGSSYRRVEGPNHATSSYSMRPDPVHYSGYDRGSRGLYFDEMSSRGSSYPVTHHELGLPRYGSVDTTPYNRTSTSTMQRYAPRLDELNPRMNNLGRSELDGLSHTRMNGLGRPELPMGGRGVGAYGPPLHGPGFRMDSMGFAPGPYNPYSQHNSGGWLNE